MIINDFNTSWPLGGPLEANPPLIVDPYRMLPFAITGKSFQLIARRCAKIGQHNGGIHHLELAAGDLKDA